MAANVLQFEPAIFAAGVQALLVLDHNNLFNPPGNNWSHQRKAVLRAGTFVFHALS